MCNNALFTLGTIPQMAKDIHESAARLYEVAKAVGTEGKSALARLLNESPQVVNNWELRGVSEGGALKAQAVIGCNAVYILTGKGDPMLNLSRPEVIEIAETFSKLTDEQIKWAMRGIRWALESAAPPPKGDEPDGDGDTAEPKDDGKQESPSLRRMV